MVRGGGAATLLAVTLLLLGKFVGRVVEGAEDDKTLVGMPCTSICTLGDTSSHCNRCRDREPMRFGKRRPPLGHLPSLETSPGRWAQKKRLVVGDFRNQHKQRTSSEATPAKVSLANFTPKLPMSISSKKIELPGGPWSTVASFGNSVHKPVIGHPRNQKHSHQPSYGHQEPHTVFGRHLLGMFNKDADVTYRVAKNENRQPLREPLRFGKRNWRSHRSPFLLLTASLPVFNLSRTASSPHATSTHSSGESSNRPEDGRQSTRRVALQPSLLTQSTKRSVGLNMLKQIRNYKGVSYWKPVKTIFSTPPLPPHAL